MSTERIVDNNLVSYLERVNFSFLESDTNANGEKIQEALKVIWDIGEYFTNGSLVSFKIPSVRLLDLGMLSDKTADAIRKNRGGNNVIMLERVGDSIVITETYLEETTNYRANPQADRLGELDSLNNRVFTQEILVLVKQPNDNITYDAKTRTIDPLKIGMNDNITAEDVSPVGRSLDSHLRLMLGRLNDLPYTPIDTLTPKTINTTLALILIGARVDCIQYLVATKYQGA